ncbi:MAG: hypothetical protein HZA83_02250 [Thaumarchaeota archaeon]|nr:hypothetical protein [Nitrososphaerota archaeon]
MQENKKIVVIDTNFLFIPYVYRIDIFSELNYLIEAGQNMIMPSSVINELNKISGQKGKNGLAAKLALKIIDNRKNSIEIIGTDLLPDEWIVKFCKDNSAIVCTNDKVLKNKIKRLGAGVITLKSRSKIGFA